MTRDIRSPLIAALAGLALGVIGKHTLTSPPETPPPPEPLASSGTPASSATVTLPLTPGWGIQGDLSSSQILALPPGAHRDAETALWSLTATPAQLAAHWDALIAAGNSDMRELDQVTLMWVQQDPDSALAHLQGTNQEYRFWWALGRKDPDKALAQVDPQNTHNFSMVIRAIGQHDPYRALEVLDRLNKSREWTSYGGIFEGLFDINPAEAFTFAAQHHYSDPDKLLKWTATDPQAAFAWCLENQDFAQNQLTDIVPLLLEHNPEFLEKQIANLETGSFKFNLLAAQIQTLAQKDPDQALALALSHTGQPQSTMLYKIGETLARSNPAKAREILDTLYREHQGQLPPAISDDPFNHIALTTRTWFKSVFLDDPQATLQLLGQHSDWSSPTAPPQAQGFAQWLELQPTESIEWLQDIPPGPQRDTLSATLVKNQIKSPHADFESLLAWSRQIESNQRNNLINATVQNWIKYQPQAAREYLTSPRATPAERALLPSNPEAP
ncbi:MAG: hypothetical protein ACSHYF_16050 [Verrucomicrobiaceae bacterium]